jgi:hypothetical protein
MDVVVDLARPEDDRGIRALVRREALPGRVRLALAREPDFSVGCAVTGDDSRIVVARSADSGEIVGVACRSIRHVFLSGHEHRIGYFGQLRVDERLRGRWLVSRGFSLLAAIDRGDPLPAYLASIVEGNDQATGVLVEKKRRRFPAFRPVASYCTLALPLRRPKPPLPGPEEIVPASLDQRGELTRFLRKEGSKRQLFSVWTEDALSRLEAFGLRLENMRIARSGGAMVGVIALWDQTAYKQSVVRGYSGWMKLLSRLSGSRAWPAAPIVPRIGEEIRSASASLVCVTGDEPRIFARLLREQYNLARAQGFAYLLVGLDVRDPLLKIARAYPHFSYPSRLYLASWANGHAGSNGGPLDAHLDERPAYVDIATL